jgi:hypothetical protein
LAFLAFSGSAATNGTSTVPLSAVMPESAHQDWGSLKIDRSVQGMPLRIGERAFAHGLGTHANSEIVYALDGACKRFTAWVGVDADMKGHTDSTVVFQVFGDGQKLFDSGVMRLADTAKLVDVPLADVEELRLVVTDAGDGISCDHADWADAVLTGKLAESAPAAKYFVRAPGLTINLDDHGRIAGSSVGAITGRTRLVGCRQVGDVVVREMPGAGYQFSRNLTDARNHNMTLTDRFTPSKDSVRWEVQIISDDQPWTTAISTRLNYPATDESRFWTSWGDPDDKTGVWQDPLVWRPFADRSWSYQFSHFTQVLGKAPAWFCIPLATLAEPKEDAAITLVQSPEDTLLDLKLTVTKQGALAIDRTQYRLGEGRTVRFAMDLVAHPADCRAGLGWMVKRYPQFFNPGIACADELSGSAAYSGNENPVDAAAFKKMGFTYNWKLSDDFPYMGHFIPPVKSMNDKWTRSCAEPAPPGKGRETSCRQLNSYARWMKDNGFHVLSYFNVTEYGKDMPWPVPPKQARTDADLWRNPADYLYHGGMASAVLMNGKRPFFSNCYGALIVDPGDPAYQAHLVEQVRRNNHLLPDTDGICIDRLDWLGHYNENADDGVSWVNDKPARSLFVSWQKLADLVVPELHKAGKVLFLNNCTPRIEVVGRGDGIFAEWASDMWDLPYYANYTALAAVRKPACLWTAQGEASDFYFQRCLYLGVYPIAPYPNNNHCLAPSAEGQNMVKNMHAAGKDDQLIPTPAAAASPEGISLAYGPLLTAMRGKKWVLVPHCVETSTAGVKVNLFEVPGGYALPVSFGGKAETAIVHVRNVPGLEKLRCEALHPGVETPVPLVGQFKDGELQLTVPLVRGCAMLRLLQ